MLFSVYCRIRENYFNFVEIKFKDIKKSLKISGIVVGSIILLVMMAFFLLQIGRVQQVIAQLVAKDLSDKIQSEISIGKVEYKLFNTISLQDVYVADLQQDTLLYIQELNAHFNLFRFFTGKIILHSAEFNELYANLSVDEKGESNFKFLIDAFSNPDAEKSNNELEYNIKRLQLENSSIRFRNFNNQKNELQDDDNQINFNRLRFDKINAELALHILNKDTLNAEIINFSGEEKSGLKLVELKTSIVGSNTQVEIPELSILLPDSRLQFANISLKYDSLPDFKDFSQKVHLEGKLHSSYVKLDDISPFAPSFKNMEAVAALETTIDGQLSNLRVRGFKIQYGESFVLNGNLDLNGLPDLEQTFVYGNLRELRLNANDTEKFISDLIEEDYHLPDAMKQLGTIRYNGNITGFFSNLVIYGELRTNIGNISTDLLLQLENNFRNLKYNGTIKSSGLNLGRMLQTENVGNIAFYFNTTGSRKMNSPFQGVIDANVSEFSLYGYEYHDIRFNGDYDGNGFNGKLKIEDENINANFNGLIDMTQELPVFDFELVVKETNLHALHLTEKYSDSKLSFNAKTNMTGSSLDNINGFLRFDSIIFINGNKALDLDEINFLSKTDKDYTNFSIESQYLNGSFSGNFKYSKLPETLTQILEEYMPSVEERKGQKKLADTQIDLDLTFSNSEKLADVLEIPHKLNETAQIKGWLDESKNMIDFVAVVPRLTSGSQHFNNTTLHVWGEKQKLEVILESNVPTENDFWNLSFYSAIQKDSLMANLEWRNRQKVVSKGEFKTLTLFSRGKNNNFIAKTSILPSQIIISDSLWNVNANGIEFEKGIVRINNFRFGNDSQHLNIDGVASKSQSDSLNIEMKEIDLDFISMLANMNGFRIGGTTTGNATILSVFEHPVFDTALSVSDLKLNKERLGNASIFSTWDQMGKQVVAIASINDGDETIALGECSYKPAENRLDVEIDANRVKLDFLSKYYDSILPNTTGYASGKLWIGGPLNEIRFDGRLKVDDGQVEVGMLGSTFYFSDTIALEPNSITFSNITLYDEEKNKVTLDGALTHNGKFKDFRYNLNVQTDNAQVANLQPGANDLFFGKAYAEATVRISGTSEDTSIRVNALTKPGTKVYIQTGVSSQTTDAGFIHFVQHHKDDEEFLFTPRIVPPSSTTNIWLNLQIEATPAAEVGLILDPISGDMISGKGNGNIRIEYESNQSDTKMYGNYTLESGNYRFTLQDVFRKEFKIESGSSVYWTGSPSKAQVNIRAIYPLTASLKDLLDEDLLNSVLDQSSRMTVPVNCILILTDNLMSPTIKFDIDLPSSDEGVKQVVRNVINTDEMLTTQILYLLVFNKFYMPNNQNVVNFGGSELWSLAASTVSAQLNNLVSQFSNNNSLSFGFDMRRVNDMDMEYQLDLLYQPNDRWIVNGNFGYRQNNTNIENYNQYITDVDIEYLLIESGKLRGKFYNHTIDRTAQLRTAKNTQGIGLIYRESFDSVGDMFRYYWRILTGKNKKKKDSEEDSI